MVEICPSSKDFLTFKFLILVGCNVLLLRPVEEREGEDEDGSNEC